MPEHIQATRGRICASTEVSVQVRDVLEPTDIKTTMRYAHLETRQVTSKARDVINRLTLGHIKREVL